jgi:hypothetical protein
MCVADGFWRSLISRVICMSTFRLSQFPAQLFFWLCTGAICDGVEIEQALHYPVQIDGEHFTIELQEGAPHNLVACLMKKDFKLTSMRLATLSWPHIIA